MTEASLLGVWVAAAPLYFFRCGILWYLFIYCRVGGGPHTGPDLHALEVHPLEEVKHLRVALQQMLQDANGDLRHLSDGRHNTLNITFG
eukprot:997991-Pyramimonas_sp.AAC.1